MQRIIDLTLELWDKGPSSRSTPEIRVTPRTTVRANGFSVAMLELSSHSGTHIDAPSHMIEGARTVDQLDLGKCVGPAKVLDLSEKGPGEIITLEDILRHESMIDAGSRIILRTDWSERFNKPDYFEDFPQLSLAAAEWLASRGIWLVGTDTPAIAYSELVEDPLAVHRALLQEEIVIVECLTALKRLTHEEFFLVVLPLKLRGGDGSPARAIAIEGMEVRE